MKRIKIKLDVPESTVAYFRLMDRWENEGGSIPVKSKEDLISGDQIPFSVGDTFRVTSGSIDLMDGAFYYISDIEILSEADAGLLDQDET